MAKNDLAHSQEFHQVPILAFFWPDMSRERSMTRWEFVSDICVDTKPEVSRSLCLSCLTFFYFLFHTITERGVATKLNVFRLKIILGVGCVYYKKWISISIMLR